MNSATVSDNQDATAAQYNNLRKDVVQQAGDYATSSGSANAYVLAVDAQIVSAYVEGTVFKFKANFANTGPATLNVNTLGAVAIKKNGGDALIFGDIKSGQVVSVIYDGTNMQMLSKPSVPDNVDTDLLAGETMDGTSAVVPVYLKASDGRLWKTDATSLAEAFYNYIGVIINSVTAGVACFLKRFGIVNYAITLAQTVGARTITYHTNTSDQTTIDGAGEWISSGFYPCYNQTNITSVTFFCRKIGTAAGTATIGVYAMDSNGKATGALLGSVTSDTTTWNSGGAEETFTFASPITLTQNPTYGYVVKLSVSAGSGGNGVMFYKSTVLQNAPDWINMPSAICWENAGGGDNGITQLYFKFSYTGVVFAPMDLIFLDTTAGQITPIIPTYPKIIGRIISSTKIDLNSNPSYTKIGTDSTTLCLYILPLGTNAIEVYVQGTVSTKLIAYNTFLQKDRSATQIWRFESNTNDLNLTVTVDWTNGILTLPTSADKSFAFVFYK